MKTNSFLAGITLAAALVSNAATNDISTVLQRGLLEEEANHNLDAAIQAYRSVAAQFDKDRKLAATAIFRLGECYRKQGDTNAANAQYERILSEFSDQPALVGLSRDYLGGSQTAATGRQPVLGDVPSLSSLKELDQIRATIKESPDLVNAPDKNGETMLQAAAAKGQLAVVKLLLENSAAINGIQEPGLTPLHYAAGNGHKAVVDLLLAKGAKVDGETANGTTPLHLAAAQGYEAVARALLQAGASVNDKPRYDDSSDRQDLHYRISGGGTPLHLAAERGYTSLVELLLSKGADLNAEDKDNRTALSHAVQDGHDAVAKQLLAAHADPNIGSDLPLAMAAERGRVQILKLLLASGADPNARHHFGGSFHFSDNTVTPLWIAVMNAQDVAVSELLRAKVDPNSPNANGDPMIFQNQALADPATLRALLDAGANPNLLRKDGTPALVDAASQDKLAAMEVLLAHKANVNATNTQGWTALHSAAQKNNKTAVELLIKNGADVNAKDTQGGTPLYYAAQQNAREAAALLLEAKADPNVRNNAGQTPLDLARGHEPPTRQGPAFAAVPTASGGPPLSYQWSAQPGALPPRAPPSPRFPGQPAGSAPGPGEPEPASLAALLRVHGAVDDLADYSVVRFMRKGPGGGPWKIFFKDPLGRNRFTLFELLTWVQVSYPDFTAIKIHRPTPGTPGKEKEIAVDATSGTNGFDCTKDVWLEFGDVVELPEREHTLTEPGDYLSKDQRKSLLDCLQRKVKFVVRGRMVDVTLTGSRDEAWLSGVLRRNTVEAILRSTSDFYRVKTTRVDPATHQAVEFTDNVQAIRDNKEPFNSGLWLRDGDVVEVPDKP